MNNYVPTSSSNIVMFTRVPHQRRCRRLFRKGWKGERDVQTFTTIRFRLRLIALINQVQSQKKGTVTLNHKILFVFHNSAFHDSGLGIVKTDK